MTESTITEGTKAVELRKSVKARKPKFRRQESWRYKRLKESWRKPRGLDNKMRKRKRGWPKSVKIGYGGPKIARGLHPSGYKEVLIHTPDDVVKADPQTQAIRISHTVGTRKRIQITSLAREKGLHILNPLVRKEAEETRVEEERIEEKLPEETAVEPEEPKKKTEEVEKKPKRSKRQKPSKEVKASEP